MITSEGIFIVELEQLMFPECFPNNHQHFKEEMYLLKQEGELDRQTFQNIHFKIKLCKYALAIKNNDARVAFYYFFQKLVEKHYSYKRPYHWQEIKSLLCFTILHCHAHNFNSFEKAIKKRITNTIVSKYLNSEKQLLKFQQQKETTHLGIVFE